METGTESEAEDPAASTPSKPDSAAYNVAKSSSMPCADWSEPSSGLEYPCTLMS